MNRDFLPSIGSLIAFESASRHENFTRTAAELNLTQGAISRQIQQLEELLDVRLFERVRHRVIVTDAGKLYLTHVIKALELLASATERIRGQGEHELSLNLAVLPTFASRWLVPRLPAFHSTHPRLTINMGTRLLPFDFATEPFDAAIHYGFPTWAGTIAYRIMNESTIPVCSPAFQKFHKLKEPADLAKVVLLHQTSRPSAWKNWFETLGVETENGSRGPRYEQFSIISQAAASGLGVALMPKFSVQEELALEKLVVPVTSNVQCDTSYYLVVPETRANSANVRAFVDWITCDSTLKDPPAA